MKNDHTTTDVLEQRAREGDVIYAAGHPDNMAALKERTPFGQQLEIIDITKMSVRPFFELLATMNGINHTKSGLTSEQWVVLDCGLIPGGYFGFAREAKDCDDELKQKLHVDPSYTGLVPVSEYCIIPRPVSGAWIGHTLSAIERGKNYGILSKLVGLKAFGVEHYTGVAQYDNNAVRTHCTIADLELRTVMTPVHDYLEMTFIYEHPVDQESLDVTMQGKREVKPYSFLLDPHDLHQKQEMQALTEEGKKKYAILFPGQVWRDGKLFVPIQEE